MKPLKIFTMILILTFSGNAHAQFWKDLKKRASEVAEETFKRKSEEKAERVTSDAFDSVFNNDILSKKERRKLRKQGNNTENRYEEENHAPGDEGYSQEIPAEEGFSAATNFGFEPGNQVFFEDDFSRDVIGDFPAKWDTNGSGEIVTINGEKWYQLKNDSQTFPMVSSGLPDNYTIEFDLLTQGFKASEPNSAWLNITLGDKPKFEKLNNSTETNLSFSQYGGTSTLVRNTVNGKTEIENNLQVDYREAMRGESRISISVNGPRFRMWVNNDKVVDVPRLVPRAGLYFKLEPRILREEKGETIYINNFRMAKTGEDLRSKLIKNGSFTTNEIQFDSGSANLKESSVSILNQMGQVLLEETSIAVKIVGHTDADGSEDGNLQLSQQRAETVKTFLSTEFNIDPSRMQTEGKGESQPVVENDTPENKAQNRRVEFIKQ